MDNHRSPRIEHSASDSHAGPRKYMSKGRRACDFCRSRKSACQIEVAPPCRMCRAHGQRCEFTDRVVRKKRRIAQPEGGEHVAAWQQAPRPSDTDLLWPQSLDFLSMSLPESGFPHVLSAEDRSMLGVGSNQESNDQLHGAFVSGPENADQFTLDDLMLGIYGGKTPSDIYQGTGDGHNSLDHATLTSQLCGLTGDMDPYVLRHYQFNDKSEFAFSKLAIRRVEEGRVPVQFMLSKPELSADSRSQTDLRNGSHASETPSRSDEIVPQEVGERLIELFFRFINPQFPVLSETNKPSPQTSPTHLLAAIYSITQPFTLFDDYLSIELAYSPPSPQTLTNIAWRSLNDEISEPTIRSVQTSLILLLQPCKNPLLLESPLKWSLLGLTVSMAQTLGLYLDPTAWNLPAEEIETRKRLSWLVWSVDKWLAFSLGRPNHISRNDWLITDLNPSNDATDHSNESYATHFAKLTNILDTVLTELYSVRSVSILATDSQRTISTARPIMQTLDEWHKSCSSQIDIAHNQNDADLSNGSASLHIAFHAVRILVFRALLRPFNQLNSRLTPDGENSEEWLAARTQIRRSALAEVTSILNLISSFRQEHYQAFWAPWSKTCFALVTNLLLLLSVTSDRGTGSSEMSQQPSPEETAVNEYMECRQVLDRARAIFRLHAKTLDMIRFALLRIDAVFWIGWERVLGYK
ncbi:hypothetical protein EYB25_006969 [Talaromyces marneffei]|uniref:Zn(2)-C6 fungal-type domain-containing protein n=1 Tax=Talaromyces marneffei (strain ATCC 18224 / CBS 334.59 / QM 7333) TaxID=441960 RepID=B6QL07_TALMQ|nr:uncharacterized protein EYB26_008110 [Talaromyces marneffei]EEA21784.1 conserved hypothetical protein [Talaromyces marneffei ATCC 18224]KAE8550741.1 hypothetical protein EYB25_006969 [Talaromyces marneffei]QGA20408.1 hypothetical protein EYB26_008110 [Talaromyces marneffei]